MLISNGEFKGQIAGQITDQIEQSKPGDSDLFT